ALGDGLLAGGGAVPEEGHLEVALEGLDLAAGCAAGLALVGVGEGVPGAGGGAEVGAAAVAVGGGDGADAAAVVHVGADNDAAAADAAEHGLLRALGHGVHGVSQPLRVVPASPRHRVNE